MDDPQIQLGLGLLYAEHGGSVDFAARARDRYDQVLATDPDDRVVRAVLAVSTLGQYLGRRDDLLTDFEQNENDEALKHIEEGNAKAYLSSYRMEKQTARLRALRVAGFPESYRRFFEDSYPVAGDFSFSKRLHSLARTHEAEGDFENAERMYRLTIGVADHIDREQLSYAVGPVQGIGPSIRAEAHRRLQALRGCIAPR